eukprot:SAG31_NODE_8522_length_1437_cov_0.928251_2_plen_186_part_00
MVVGDGQDIGAVTDSLPQVLRDIGVIRSNSAEQTLEVQTASWTITAVAEDADSARYYAIDSDTNKLNDLPPLAGIDELRQRCADFGLQAVRVTSAAQVDEVLRPMLQEAGYDLSRGSGVPLGMDYSLSNVYEALDDAGVSVSAILTELHASRGYSGDHETDQTGDMQHLAGFGWARSDTDVGIEE